MLKVLELDLTTEEELDLTAEELDLEALEVLGG